jgi:hypothetical protein
MQLKPRPTPTPSVGTTASMELATCFVFGTLMSPEVLQVLLGRIPSMISNVILPKYTRHPTLLNSSPAIIPAVRWFNEDGTLWEGPSACSVPLDGVLLLDLKPHEMKIMDRFMFVGEETHRAVVQVQIPSKVRQPDSDWVHFYGEMIHTYTHLFSHEPDDLNVWSRWNYTRFLQEDLSMHLQTRVEPFRSRLEREMPEIVKMKMKF